LYCAVALATMFVGARPYRQIGAIMSRILILLGSLAVVLGGLTTLGAPQPRTAARDGARPEDVKSVDSILAALYDCISGPAGKERDWERFRALFVPKARLIPIAKKAETGAEARVLDVDEFIKLVDENTRQAGFFEKEIARKTDAFGRVAQVFSTYESRRAPEDKPFTRGINSIQLLKDGDRWWVVTIFWDSETKDRPIPSAYLP
jgi:hypothetical protein